MSEVLAFVRITRDGLATYGGGGRKRFENLYLGKMCDHRTIGFCMKRAVVDGQLVRKKTLVVNDIVDSERETSQYVPLGPARGSINRN